MLRDLSLWDKRDDKIMTLSGGMKRRVMIAKALAHEPEILFLDEPTAGVDVELRRDMWALVRRLRESGVTIILTTHYIEEAEEMADRIGVINKGELIVVEEKAALMKKLGKQAADAAPAGAARRACPPALAGWPLVLKTGGSELEYTFDAHDEHTGIPALLRRLGELGIGFKDLKTRQSSLEDIFVEPGERRAERTHEPAASTLGVWAIYRFEMARFRRTLLAELVDAGHHHLALFRRVRLGDRLAHERGGRRELRRVHRAGADHAVAVHREHLQRLVRHLPPEVHRHDLRDAVRAGVVPGDRAGLRRRGGDQVDDPRARHPRRPRRSSCRCRSMHPFWMVAFLVLTAATFSLFGFIIGIWAKGFEQLQFIPMLVVTPLTFLGGAFYSIDMLPPAWRTFSLFNPVVYLISGFRWTLLRHGGRQRRGEPRR